MKNYFLLLALTILFASCSQQPQTGAGTVQQTNESAAKQPAQFPIPEAQQAFYTNLSKLCGKSFRGTTIFPTDDKDPFAGKELVMHVSTCSDTTIRIPFHVGEDKSRTWVLSKTNKGLQLKHDHRHEDGTPDEITMYGGIALDTENTNEVRFPADAFTAKLIPAAATNEWTLALSPDGKTFSYILKRDNQLRFRADFDLTKPL